MLLSFVIKELHTARLTSSSTPCLSSHFLVEVYTKVGRVMLHRPDGKLGSDAVYRANDVDLSNLPGSSTCIFPDAPRDVIPVFDYSDRGIYHSYNDSLMRIGMNIHGLRVHDLQNVSHYESFMNYGGNGLIAMLDLRLSKKIKDISIGSNDVGWTKSIITGASDGEINSILLANNWNLIDHSDEAFELFETCKARGIKVTNAGVFASGILASVYTDKQPLRSGDRVEVRYKLGMEWRQGCIIRIGGMELYDIEYDDGEVEEDVQRLEDGDGDEVVRPVHKEHMYKYAAVDRSTTGVMDKVEVWLDICKSFENIPLPAVALHFALLPADKIDNICVGFKTKNEVVQVVDWLKRVKVPPELWTMAFHRKVLSTFAYEKVFSSYNVDEAFDASKSILNARYTLSDMRTEKNTVNIQGQRFFDARDTIVDFFALKGVEDAEEGEMTFYIQHGKSLRDPPSMRARIRQWVLEAYKKAKRVEPCEGDESFTVVEFDFSCLPLRKQEDGHVDHKEEEGKVSHVTTDSNNEANDMKSQVQIDTAENKETNDRDSTIDKSAESAGLK